MSHIVHQSASIAAALLSFCTIFIPSLEHFCYCNSPTSPANVELRQTLSREKLVLKRLGRCFIWLKTEYHISKDCHSSSRCQKCCGKHHTSIWSKASIRSPKNDKQLTSSWQAVDSQSYWESPPIQQALNSPKVSIQGINLQGNTFDLQLPAWQCALTTHCCSKLPERTSTAGQAHSQQWRSECCSMIANVLASPTKFENS